MGSLWLGITIGETEKGSNALRRVKLEEALAVYQRIANRERREGKIERTRWRVAETQRADAQGVACGCVNRVGRSYTAEFNRLSCTGIAVRD